MSPINITDRDTEKLVRRLAECRALGLTEAVRLAVGNELLKDGIEAVQVAREQPAHKDAGSLEEALDDAIRATILEYTRLLAKQRGTKSVGSRVYQMLNRYGAVGTLAKLVDRPTSGLEFLKSVGRLDLAAETIALDPRFESIIPDDVRALARTNLHSVASVTR